MAALKPPKKPLEASIQLTEEWCEKKQFALFGLLTITGTVSGVRKYTVYKVVVSSDTECWFVFRRYNHFYTLYDILRKEYGVVHLKFPGKKLFGNNLDPEFVAARRRGLEEFIQQLLTDLELLKLAEVKTFFGLDRKINDFDNEKDKKISINLKFGQIVEGSVKCSEDDAASPTGENIVDLGPSERICAGPGDFQFLHLIGKGSFGKVLLAKHKTDKNYYAVKVISKNTIIQENKAHHVMSERNILLKTLNHPFLVGLKYSFQTSGKLYFVLDYINGGELFFHLQRERCFPEPRARFYAAEIASALGYLHSRGIIYRDLKPENLLLDKDGHVVLTDFGLSKEGLLPTDTTNTFCGTPDYLAPEIIRNMGYNAAVDWWCLGAVLYEMLYGLPPFHCKNKVELYNRILYKAVRINPVVSVASRKILLQLLEKDPRKRLGSGYGDFDDVKHHDFFQSINWDDLINKRISPPFRPTLRGDTDLKYIDPQFTNESLRNSVTTGSVTSYSSISLSCHIEDMFVGFSYTPSRPHCPPTA